MRESLQPLGRYLRGVRVGDLILVSGHTSRDASGNVLSGTVGVDLDVEGGRKAARLAAQNVLDAVEAIAPGSGAYAASVRVYVRCAPDFESHSAIADSASEIIQGPAGPVHARTAIGVTSLPGGAAAEVEAIFTVPPGRPR
jgi:enamine deaminase RidA (YjgF/YER057c/UK114 family)